MATSNVNVVISGVGRRYLRLQLTAELGPIRLRKLLAFFGSVESVLSASNAQLERVDGIGPHVAASIRRSCSDGQVEQEIERAEACGVRIVCPEDADYPQPLLQIPDGPICLYMRGRLEPADAVAVAIVGTRRCSHYGREQALRFGELLGGAGFTVVSGMARGIDSCAHSGALAAGGRTIAVLGNGLASVYPAEHEALGRRVAASGALLSELPLDAQPTPENFPRRNRIIAGLALGVIVVEAGARSGAMITARLATDYNRELFALPGRVDRPEFTAGVSKLIREGQAKLITCLDDVLDELGPVGEVMGRAPAGPDQPDASSSGDAQPSLPNLAGREQAVLDAILAGAEDADNVASVTGFDIGQVMSVLTSLQLKGLIRQLPGRRVVPRTSAGSHKPAR